MKTYASKLLLFGEYTIINGSRALAIPFDRYSGSWQYGPEPDARLHGFAEYLQMQPAMATVLAIPRFLQDIRQGLFFRSDIPTGYGLGSSGALCAAVYDRYAAAPVGREEIPRFEDLRRQLAVMESYFHGSSSGADPLISYLNYAVVLHPEHGIRKVALPPLDNSPLLFFLLDTGMPRATGPLVERYLAKCRDAAYSARIEGELQPQVDLVIDAFLAADWESAEQAFVAISRIQARDLLGMIPAGLLPLWQRGLALGGFALKLCGAGGGGFLLGICRSEAMLRELQAQYPCERIW